MTWRTRTSIEDSVIDWIESIFPTGRAIVAWPNAPRPELPYVSIQVLSVSAIGFDDHGVINTSTGYQTIHGDRLVTVSVQAYGTGALDKIQSVVNSISKDSVRAALMVNGLCPHQPGIVNDLTRFLDSDTEERAQADIIFGIKDIDTDNVGIIERVTGDGSIIRETGDMIVFSFDSTE